MSSPPPSFCVFPFFLLLTYATGACDTLSCGVASGVRRGVLSVDVMGRGAAMRDVSCTSNRDVCGVPSEEAVVSSRLIDVLMRMDEDDMRGTVPPSPTNIPVGQEGAAVATGG